MSDNAPYYLLRPDGTPLSDPIVGTGRSGVVVQREGTAVKLPLSYGILEGGEREKENLDHKSIVSKAAVEQEKRVFERLGRCDGVVPCIDLTGPGLQLELMENGNLRNYLRRNRTYDSTLLSWARQMARTLVLIHERRVILTDITTGSFLLTTDCSIQYSGFGEAIILSPGADLDTPAESGHSIHTDFAQLGAVLYEIISGRRSRFDLYKHQTAEPVKAAIPPRNTLPGTKNILLGEFIDQCWTQDAFDSEYDLLASLDSTILKYSLENHGNTYSQLGSHKNIAKAVPYPCSSLDTVLLQQKEPDWTQRLIWIREAANAVSHAHSKGVIIANIAASNFIVDSHGAIRLFNFSDARIVTKEPKLRRFDENGVSVKNDVVCYGSLVYHIVTGRRPEFSINKRGDLPGAGLKQRLQQDLSSAWEHDANLPSGADQVIYDVILNCWSRGKCGNMKSVCHAVSQFSRPQLMLHSLKVSIF